MRLRRRPNPERVRHTLRELPPSMLANEYGEEIVRLRGAMQRALDCLDGTHHGEARAKALLRTTLEREGWWQR